MSAASWYIVLDMLCGGWGLSCTGRIIPCKDRCSAVLKASNTFLRKRVSRPVDLFVAVVDSSGDGVTESNGYKVCCDKEHLTEDVDDACHKRQAVDV